MQNRITVDIFPHPDVSSHFNYDVGLRNHDIQEVYAIKSFVEATEAHNFQALVEQEITATESINTALALFEK